MGHRRGLGDLPWGQAESQAFWARSLSPSDDPPSPHVCPRWHSHHPCLMVLDRRMVTHNPTSCAWPDHPLTLSLGDFLGKVGVNTQSSCHSCCAKTQSLATNQVLWAFGVSSGGQRQLGSAHTWMHVRTDTHTDTHALRVLFFWRTPIDTGLVLSSLSLSFLAHQARMMII